MADKKKNTRQGSMRSQNQMVAPKARSDEKEQDKTAKAVAPACEKNDRKVQESSKPVRRESKAPSPLQVRLRTNRYFRFIFDAYYELRHKVTWPSFNEARNMTIAVLLLSAAVGALLGLADFGLQHLYVLLVH